MPESRQPGRPQTHPARTGRTQTGRARREVSAGGVVFRLGPEEPQFALIKASGRWLFPKGNIETGETSEHAALREISEETGLPADTLQVVRPLPSIEYVFRWEGRLVFKTVHNFLVAHRGNGSFNPQLSEIEDAGWFNAAVARRVLSFKNARETLDTAVAAVETFRVAS